MIPLALAPMDRALRIVRIGTSEQAKKRLGSLGLSTSSILFVTLENHGDLVVRFKESRLAIDRNLAMHIFIKEA